MRKLLLSRMMLLLCALMVGSGSVWAEDEVYYTLDGTITSGGNSNYTQDGGGLTQDNLSWSVTGNTTINPWRIGGKNLTDVDREAYSKTAMGAAITKVELELGSKTLTVNSITFIVASDADFKNQLYSKTETSNTSSTTLTFSPTSPDTEWATGAYYKFVFNVTAGSSNSYVQLISAKFYTDVTLTDPTITFNDGSVRVGKTLDLNTLFTSNSAGAVTYSITEGGSYASIDGSTLTGVAEGSVTVQASQAAAGAYNAKTASATITVNAALTLSSIAITTAPTKTVYDEGEVFDATGMVVTATYSDNSTDDATALCTWTPSGALTTSDTEITISYTENGTTKTATQTITVNEYVQPTTVTIQMTNSLFNQEAYTSNSKSTEELTFTGTQDNVTVTYYVPKDSYYYFNTSNTRPYNTCTLTYSAPTGYAISKIVFTSDGSNWKTATCSTGSMTGTKTWEGFAKSITFSWEESGTRIKTVVVTLTQQVPVTVTSAEYATYCGAIDLDFSTTGITAYTATDGETKVTLNEITTGQVPANTPVVLYKAGADGTAISVPVIAEADAISGTNDLRVSTGTDVDYMYVLANKANGVGFYPWGGSSPLSAGKVYLQAKASYGARAFLGFDEDINAVEAVSTLAASQGEYFNLSGQRVAQPQKGIFVVNGRKVVIR